MKSENPCTIYVSTGDLLYPRDTPKPFQVDQADAIAGWMLSYFPGDLVHLTNRDRKLLKNKLPTDPAYVLLQAVDDKSPATQIIEVQGLTLGFITLDPADPDKPISRDWIKQVNQTAATLRTENNVWAVIALSTLGYGTDQQIRKELSDIDILLGIHHEKFLEVSHNDEFFLSGHIADHAKYIGILELEFQSGFPKKLTIQNLANKIKVHEIEDKIATLDRKMAVQKKIGTPNAKKIIQLLTKRQLRFETTLETLRADLGPDSYLHRGLPLDSRAPEDQTLTALTKNLRPSLKKVNINAPENLKRDLNTIGYAGADTCKTCHPRQIEFVKKHKHTSAWHALVKSGSDGDVSCIVCHSAGFGTDEGVKHISQIKPFTGVQCESCHGPGRAHTENPETRSFEKVTPKTCNRCHTLEHSDEKIDSEMMKRFHCPPQK